MSNSICRIFVLILFLVKNAIGQLNDENYDALENDGINCSRKPTISDNIINQLHDFIEPEPFLNLRCGKQNTYNQRIVGGVEANIGEFPWVVILYYGNHSLPKCGGSIIHKNFIVTAAHCIAGSIIQIYGKPEYVRTGEHYLYTNPDCSRRICADPYRNYQIKAVYPYPEYLSISLSQYHDIGIIRLIDDIQFTAFVQPICLPNDDSEYYVSGKDTFFISGWGRTEYAQFSATKLKAIVPYVSKSMCQQMYSKNSLRTIGDGQICAGGELDVDSCSGDSGNGLMDTVITIDNAIQWVLIGVVSYGPKECGQVNYPGVYTRIGKYLKWIKRRVYNSLNM